MHLSDHSLEHNTHTCGCAFLHTQEWDSALAERFLFHLPVKVNWDFFDAAMLPAFWASSGERRRLRGVLPDMADRVRGGWLLRLCVR